MRPSRLCIDGRVASELACPGLVAQEAIDQLGLAWSASETDAESKINQTYLLAHPAQAFSGRWHRIDSGLKLRRTPMHWAWEKKLLGDSAMESCHRFRPVDRMTPVPSCPTLTTILPPIHGLPFYISRREAQHFVVPSTQDAHLLEKSYHVPKDQITLLRPTIRRGVLGAERSRSASAGRVMFLLGGSRDLPNLKRWMKLISRLVPNYPKVVVPIDTPSLFRRKLSGKEELSGLKWMKRLEDVHLLFYLSAPSFDWPTLALEALYRGIPTIFADRNASLSELLPGSRLKLTRFLVETPTLAELTTATNAARERLGSQGVWDADAPSREYQALYAKLQRSN